MANGVQQMRWNSASTVQCVEPTARTGVGSVSFIGFFLCVHVRKHSGGGCFGALRVAISAVPGREGRRCVSGFAACSGVTLPTGGGGGVSAAVDRLTLELFCCQFKSLCFPTGAETVAGAWLSRYCIAAQGLVWYCWCHLSVDAEFWISPQRTKSLPLEFFFL